MKSQYKFENNDLGSPELYRYLRKSLDENFRNKKLKSNLVKFVDKVRKEGDKKVNLGVDVRYARKPVSLILGRPDLKNPYKHLKKACGYIKLQTENVRIELPAGISCPAYKYLDEVNELVKQETLKEAVKIASVLKESRLEVTIDEKPLTEIERMIEED